jgi:hypothetical protein
MMFTVMWPVKTSVINIARSTRPSEATQKLQYICIVHKGKHDNRINEHQHGPIRVSYCPLREAYGNNEKDCNKAYISGTGFLKFKVWQQTK